MDTPSVQGKDHLYPVAPNPRAAVFHGVEPTGIFGLEPGKVGFLQGQSSPRNRSRFSSAEFWPTTALTLRESRTKSRSIQPTRRWGKMPHSLELIDDSKPGTGFPFSFPSAYPWV
jgi:hypothetical protein